MMRAFDKRLVCAATVLVLGCGDRKIADPYGDYGDENVTVIGGESATDTAGQERVLVSGPAGDGECVQFSDSLCVPVDTNTSWCEREGGPVDVIMVEGEVVEVICYPPSTDEDRPTVHVDTTTEGDVNVVQNANNTTVVFHNDTDGQPIAGDLNVAGNNVAVYGNGMDNTIIDGDVSLDGNNVRMRGLTINGNLSITKNAAAVVMCRVLGNVLISKNESVFVENDVFGNIEVTSNGGTITGNDVKGTWTIDGHNHVCDANHPFVDSDKNQQVGDDERSADTLTCGGVTTP